MLIDGLASATKYNGKRGIVSSGLLNGRYAVWVESERKSIAIRPQHLLEIDKDGFFVTDNM